MKVERLISIFNRQTEELVEEINVDYIPLDTLKVIFGPREDDPLMLDPYQIDEKTMNTLSRYLKSRIEFDFKKFIYQLDCFDAS
ncbi:MAG TPA: hypothetical protein VGD35_23900 [Chitinophaga sp.]